MALSILVLAASGETDYINKHNTNYNNIKVAIESLQSAIGGGSDPGATVPISYDAMFGAADAILGYGSYLPSQASPHNLDVAAGFAYLKGTDNVVTRATVTSIDFTGQTTGTHYISVDDFGDPSRSDTATLDLYSVYYDSGTGNFSNITRTANLVWTQPDWDNAMVDIWNRQQDQLGDRLAAVENSSLSILERTALATNITLTEAEAFEHAVIRLQDGPQTADIELIIPNQARVYSVINDATTAHNVTIKTSGGTGYVIGGSHYAIVYCDGTDCTGVFDLDRSGGGTAATSFTGLSDVPSSYVDQRRKLVQVSGTENTLVFYPEVHKQHVDAASTVDLTLSGEQIVDGVVLTSGDRVLCKDQSPDSENGIYVVGAGVWSRAPDGDQWDDYVATLVAVKDGTANGNKIFKAIEAPGGILDTNPVRFEELGGAGAAETFTGLTDTPADYTGDAKKTLRVNSGETALEYIEDPYFASGFFPGAGTASATMLVHVFGRAITFPTGLTGSQGTAEAAATAQTDYDIKKNGASVGTMRFAAAATTATFIMASATSFAIGDKLQLIAPGTLDSTLVDISMTLKGDKD